MFMCYFLYKWSAGPTPLFGNCIIDVCPSFLSRLFLHLVLRQGCSVSPTLSLLWLCVRRAGH